VTRSRWWMHAGVGTSASRLSPKAISDRTVVAGRHSSAVSSSRLSKRASLNPGRARFSEATSRGPASATSDRRDAPTPSSSGTDAAHGTHRSPLSKCPAREARRPSLPPKLHSCAIPTNRSSAPRRIHRRTPPAPRGRVAAVARTLRPRRPGRARMSRARRRYREPQPRHGTARELRFLRLQCGRPVPTQKARLTLNSGSKALSSPPTATESAWFRAF
jgi:hypothetical protein